MIISQVILVSLFVSFTSITTQGQTAQPAVSAESNFKLPLPRKRSCYAQNEFENLRRLVEEENELAQKRAVEALGLTFVGRHDAFFIDPEHPVGHVYGTQNGKYAVVDIVRGRSFAGAKEKTSVAVKDNQIFAIQYAATSKQVPIKTCSPYCNPGRGIHEGLKRVTIQLRADETFGGIVWPKVQKIYLLAPVPTKKECPPVS